MADFKGRNFNNPLLRESDIEDFIHAERKGPSGLEPRHAKEAESS
jgi:hypothetical protein